MSVYYESLCPDSIRFVTQQLYPNWLHFGPEILTVDLNPFGKANVSIECPYMCCLHVAVLQFSVSGSGWDFTCQHGPDECRGNKVQACVLDQVTTLRNNCSYSCQRTMFNSAQRIIYHLIPFVKH